MVARTRRPQDGPRLSSLGASVATDRDQAPTPFENFVTRPTNSKMVPFNAWSLAKASSLAYKVEDEVTHELKSWGFENVKTLGYKNDKSVQFKLTQAFVAWNDGIVLVCFRGTESRRDWLNNANLRLGKDGPFGASIHSGFQTALHEACDDTTILEKVVSEVKAVSGEGRALYLTGHSLGGALATLTAAHLLERDVSMTGLYTYGSPRVGDAAFAREFNRRAKALTHRFVNRQDGVTRLPVRRLGFRHVGEMWYLSGEDMVSNPGWWRQVVDVVRFNPDGELDVAADHSLVDGYIPSLELKLKE